jgi:hypothetical protein
MSKSNTFENDLLLLIFNNTSIANIGDAGGLIHSTTAGSLYLSLHTSDPGEGGDQTTNEATYTGYARVAVARSSAGWTVSGGSVTLAANADFPIGGGGSGTVTHFGVGTVDLATGAGKLMYSGTVTPNIITGSGITPRLTTATAITED